MDPHVRTPHPLRTRVSRTHERLVRLTASTAAGGLMAAGLPLALDYVVRPGDTLSQIAARHDTSVDTIVARNDLHRSGDRIVAGQSLAIPSAHGRTSKPSKGEKRRAAAAPDERRIVHYTVKPGDTPSGLAVRFRAWTAELVEMNGSVLRVGERIKIPVVVAAADRDRRTPASRPATKPGPKADGARSSGHRAGPSRTTVRRVVAATARRHGVDPALALAVSWQESGWQMNRVSSAGAVGAMQVIPSTGRWMSGVVGRKLHLRDLQDNATAGVVLLKLLQDQARPRVAVAGYYQGLAGVRRHGMYDDTKRYVANVMALKQQFERGNYPA
jgi:N-acetylmuramoyl-L-alanine amidase